jgi:hypothetical protein
LSYTAAQIKALVDALDFATQAVERLVQAQLPLESIYIQEAESHLFRAHAALQAILKNIGQARATAAAAKEDHAFGPVLRSD